MLENCDAVLFYCVYSLQISSHTKTWTFGWLCETCQSALRLTGKSMTLSTLGSRLRFFASFEVIQNSVYILYSQVFVVVVIDLHHWGIDTGPKALHLQGSEHAVLGGVAQRDSKVFLNGLDNDVRASTSEHAWCGGAHLHKELAHWFSVKHGVKSDRFVDPHAGHLEHLSHFVHGGNGKPVVILPLRQVQQRETGAGLVTLRVVADDGFCSLHVFWCEFKRSIWIICWVISVNKRT